MIHILLDNNNNHFPVFAGTERHVSTHCRNKYASWIKGTFSVIRKSSTSDTIVCWLDIQAVLCYWICALTLRRRRIIAINILLKDKSTIFNRIAKSLYRRALKSENFQATVTSSEYGRTLNSALGINKHYTLLRDLFPDEYLHWEKRHDGQGVFCGGNNSRDWEFIIEIARRMSMVTFRLVMPEQLFKAKHKDLPENVIAGHSLSEHEFIQEMSKCAVVCLPLTTDAPAGLIVLYQAAALGKMVIASDTATMREYISDESGIILKNDIESWIDNINKSLSNPDAIKQKAEAMFDFLKINCSQKIYADTIRSMIPQLQATGRFC